MLKKYFLILLFLCFTISYNLFADITDLYSESVRLLKSSIEEIKALSDQYNKRTDLHADGKVIDEYVILHPDRTITTWIVDNKIAFVITQKIYDDSVLLEIEHQRLRNNLNKINGKEIRFSEYNIEKFIVTSEYRIVTDAAITDITFQKTMTPIVVSPEGLIILVSQWLE
ncbi:MAG: hypothetical protein FWH35_00825 [Treponema sp.]|nr:hypothetical protein [Treponema sp.]